MKLSDFAIKRPVTMLMVVVVIMILGVVSLSKMSIDLLPNVDVPVIVVITAYPGAASEEIEDTVTKPIEKSVSGVENVKTILSDSQPNVSAVQVRFKWGVDLDIAAMNVREKLDLIKGSLPENAEEPIVIKLDPSMMPVLILGMEGQRDTMYLKQLADDMIVKRLERVEGVSSVMIVGGAERQIRIKVYPDKLSGYKVAFSQVISALKAGNINLPAGEVDYGNRELLVKTTGEFNDVEEIRNLVVVNRQGAIVRLRDIADVQDAQEDVKIYSRINENEGLRILVQKQSDANSVRVAENVKKQIAEIEKTLPSDIKITEILDQSNYIQKAIDNVASNAIQGAILAILVIFIFLHNYKSTLVIAVSIPFSIVTTIVIMYFFGITLNVMSLGGLAIGVGMLVDNSIVVLENIYRHQSLGKDKIEAASIGASEMTLAIMASTLTTIAVFVPIVFIEGITSTIFKELSLTITFALLSSIFVAITIVPLLSSRLVDVRETATKKMGFLNKVFQKSDEIYAKVDAKYGQLLAWSLGHRKIIVLAMVGLIAISALAAPLVGSEFFPETDEGKITVEVSLPLGSKVDATDEVMRYIEKKVMEIPEVERFSSQVGTTTLKTFLGTGTTEIGSMDIKLVYQGERKRSTKDIAEELRQKIGEVPGAEIDIKSATIISRIGSVTGSDKPIQVAIKGEDFDVLEELSNKVEKIVRKVPGTRDIETTMEEGRPEVQVRVDKNKASYYGLDTYSVAATVRASINGAVATQYKVAGSEVDINVQLVDMARKTLEDLKAMTIMSPQGVNVPLNFIADFNITEGPNVIKREDQERLVYVSADIYGRNLSEVIHDIESQVENLQMPEGYSINFEGQNKEMVEAFAELKLAMILAVILVYAVMASQFESLLHPFTIMFSLPVASFGVVFGLLLNRRSFNVPSYMGIIMLAGIAVNNAIVLVDYINQLKAQGKSTREAIIEAGPTRLRAISMTTLTTVLGLLPLSLGLGEAGEIQAPLAVVVMYGLLVSTLLTLIVVPVMYSIFDDVHGWLGRKTSSKQDLNKEMM